MSKNLIGNLYLFIVNPEIKFLIMYTLYVWENFAISIRNEEKHFFKILLIHLHQCWAHSISFTISLFMAMLEEIDDNR